MLRAKVAVLEKPRGISSIQLKTAQDQAFEVECRHGEFVEKVRRLNEEKEQLENLIADGGRLPCPPGRSEVEHRKQEVERHALNPKNKEKRTKRTLESKKYQGLMKERQEYRKEMVRLKVVCDFADKEAKASKTTSSASKSSLCVASIDESDYVCRSMRELMETVNNGHDWEVDPQLLVLPRDADPPCWNLDFPGYLYKEWARARVCATMLNFRLVKDVAKETRYYRPVWKNYKVGK